MNISFSKYQLFPTRNSKKKPREGALLKIEQIEGESGYADCHPWPELGDHSLDHQLCLLSKKKLTPLTKQSLNFAKIDAESRVLKTHLFEGLETPPNHHHLSEGSLLSEELLVQLANKGIQLIKIKVGSCLQDDCQILKAFSERLRSHHLKLRLDFNCQLDKEQFLGFLKQCSQYLDVVDFFEDPFPYIPKCWQEIREEKHINLACDRKSLQALSYPQSCDFLVIKPAIQAISPFLKADLKGRHLVMTSYLDHPIGTLTGLYMAAKIFNEKPEILSTCGFLSHHAYAETPFSQAFKQNGAQLIPLKTGYGFGYDELLEDLKWTIL